MLTLNQHFELIDFGATLKVANVLKQVVREYVNRKTLARPSVYFIFHDGYSTQIYSKLQIFGLFCMVDYTACTNQKIICSPCNRIG